MKLSLFTRILGCSLLLQVASFWILPTDLLGQSVTRRPSLDAAMEPDAIAVEGLVPKKIRLILKGNTPIYYQSDQKRVLGQMRAGSSVELLAISPQMYRVRGQATHGGVSGWLPRQLLLSTDPDLHQKLQQLYDRQVKVEQLIKDKTVAIGMTEEEVTACLGKPDRKARRTTASKEDQTLEYVVIESVPYHSYVRDAYGRVTPVVVYKKEETGRVSIKLRNGYVTVIEEVKGRPLEGRILRNYLPQPIYIR